MLENLFSRHARVSSLRNRRRSMKAARRTAQRRPVVEQLEARALLSTINWVNRGDGTDSFDTVFGPNDDLARAVVDAALDDWEQVITDFQQAVLVLFPFPHFENPNTINITLSMDPSDTGFGGGAGAPASYDFFGHPLGRSISIDSGNDTNGDGMGDGAGWYLDANPSDHAEFAGPIFNAFVGQATVGGPADNLNDLYSLVTIEMNHALGLTNFADSGSPAWTGNPFLTNTGVADSVDTPGTLWTFSGGPSGVTALLTTNNGGPGGTNTGNPLHVALPPQTNAGIPAGFSGALDVGNASGTGFPGDLRFLPSLLSSLMLSDVYGYTLAAGGADVFGTMHALLNTTSGNLLVRGMTGASVSADSINISRDGGQLVVSVDVGPTGDVPGTGPTGPLESRFAIGSVSSITINGLDGADTINLSGDLSFLSGAISVTGDGGADTLTVNFASGNPVPGSGLSFDGGTGDAGPDLLVLQNGTFATETYTSSGPSSGTIALSGGTNITYSNLSPIDDTLIVTDMFFNADLTSGDFVEIENSPVAGRSRIRSANSTFELVDYANKTNLTVNGRGGGDRFNLTATVVAPGLTSLTINGGTGGDTINVSTTIVPTTLNGEDATDTINIYGTASALTANGGDQNDTINIGNAGNSLDDIQGAVTVNGNGDTGDTLNLNDQGDADPHTYIVNATTLDRNGAALVTYATVEGIVVNGGSGGNTVNVRGTPTGTTVTVNSGTGGDTISVGNLANSLDDIQGPVTINGQTPPAGEPLTINDQGDLDAHTYTIDGSLVTRTGAANISYATVENLTLNAGLAGDTINVQNTSTPATTVNGGAEDDTINVLGTGAGAPLTVNGGDDDDTINVGSSTNSLDGILGAVTVNGNAPAASDALNVNDQGDADANDYVITSSTVTRAGAAQITYGTVESLTVNGGLGGNTINVQSTLATTPVVVNAGAGSDAIRVDDNGGPLEPPDGTVDLIVSSLTINGQGGTNTLLLEDFSDPNAVMPGDLVHVTPTQIGANAADSFFGAGGSLTYSGLAHVTLDLSNGYFPDTVYLIPSTTTEFELHGNEPDCPMQPDQLPGDALYVDIYVDPNPVLVSDGEGNSVWMFDNHQDVAFDGFEKLNHVGIIVVAPDSGSEPLVRVFNAETGTEKFSFYAFDPSFKGGVRVAVGDTNCDGIPDIIVAAGPGGAPEVRVFNGVTGEPQTAGVLGGFLAYDPGSKAGVWVAAGDINQDGFVDIITGPDNGGGPPIVKVFSGEDGSLHAQFLAYGGNFQGGVRVAAGDINGDVFPDIITAPGPGMAPQVRVFDGTDLTDPVALYSFLAFSNSYRRGLYLAVGDVNDDGRADIVASGGAGGARLVRVFDGTDLTAPPVVSFQPYQSQSGDSIRVALVDINEDGDLELVTAPGPGGQDDPKVFDFVLSLDPDEVDAFFAAEFDFAGGYFVAGGG